MVGNTNTTSMTANITILLIMDFIVFHLYLTIAHKTAAETASHA